MKDLVVALLSGPIGTLLVPGYAPPDGNRPGVAYLNLLHSIGTHARRAASVCGGPGVYAEIKRM
ncbi:hypothetical protein [Nonomuraea sp. NPDC048901]|uniref:hypothetical protein n=1 Tax=Nonomuraea sp. NPDC048901 TaxID=3155627 RepID=UPI0033E2503E